METGVSLLVIPILCYNKSNELIQRCYMIQHRCPWCGEKIPVHFAIIGPWNLEEPEICPKCKNLYTSSSPNRYITVIFAATLVLIHIGYVVRRRPIKNVVLYWVYGIASLLLFTLAFVEIFRIPYARGIKKKDRQYINPKRNANVNLFWENHKKEGLLLPRFQVLDGEIFPACFMDADGTPISTAFCIALHKLSWSDNFHCACKIYFVLDDVHEEKLFQEGNQFYLYHNYRKIATGTVL